jgi:hypothetical protein
MQSFASGGQTLQKESQTQNNEDPAAMTGLWRVAYVSGGMVIDQGWDQWHSDGTEILNDTPPPALGNVCVGVWKKTGNRTFQLLHPAWNFDPSGVTVVSIFILRQEITLDANGNTFSGSFSMDSYDFSGHPLPGSHVAGTVTGKRITVTGPFPF